MILQKGSFGRVCLIIMKTRGFPEKRTTSNGRGVVIKWDSRTLLAALSSHGSPNAAKRFSLGHRSRRSP